MSAYVVDANAEASPLLTWTPTLTVGARYLGYLCRVSTIIVSFLVSAYVVDANTEASPLLTWTPTLTLGAHYLGYLCRLSTISVNF